MNRNSSGFLKRLTFFFRLFLFFVFLLPVACSSGSSGTDPDPDPDSHSGPAPIRGRRVLAGGRGPGDEVGGRNPRCRDPGPAL